MTDNIHKRIGERLKLALELRGMGLTLPMTEVRGFLGR
jgi:hypothetical protein